MKLPTELKQPFYVNRKASTIDIDSRTVRVAFASGEPIAHYFGNLKLSMEPGHVRTERLRRGAAVLMEHDPNRRVGVVQSFSFDRDGIARADLRLSRSAAATEVLQDVADDVIRFVSVGFVVHAMEAIDKAKDLYLATDWEPYEISFVAIPADIRAGVGRAFEKNTMKPNQEPYQELIDFGGIFGDEGREIARDLLARNANTTQEDIRLAIKASRDARPQPKISPLLDPLDQAAKENGGYYQPATVSPRYSRLAAFSGPNAEERAYRFGQWVLGGPLGNRAAAVWCQQNGLQLARAQVEGINSKGGFLVPEEFGMDFVQLLEKYGVIRQHARVVQMNSDAKTDFVLNDELVSQFVGELQEGDDQDLDFGMIGYMARKHMILVPMSSEVVEDSAISIGDQLADAAGRAFAKKEDLCSFIGDATSTFGGITGITTALKSVDANPANVKGLQVGSGNAYSELTLADFEGVVGRLPDYADIGNAKWFVSRRFYFDVMMKILLNASGVTATEIEDGRNRKFLGYPVVFTPVMPSTEANSQVCAIFGDLMQGARLADRRAFTTAIDESILYRKDALLFRATARFDFNCSFGVGDTTKAGPIVGLITAAS